MTISREKKLLYIYYDLNNIHHHHLSNFGANYRGKLY